MRPPLFLLALCLGTVACAAPVTREQGQACLNSMTDEEAADIAKRIWEHESGGKLVIWWDDTCDCPSLGLNNYLWFPKGHQAPFQESFLALLEHMQSRGVALPEQLRGRPDAPWRTRKEMFAEVLTVEWARKKPRPEWGMTPADFTEQDSPRAKELKDFLQRTTSDQLRFSAQRAVDSLPKMLAALPEGERPAVERQFYRVACSRGGMFDLIDYVNFKGEGVNPVERYPNIKTGEPQGWGLLQVLQGMKGRATGQAALNEFADAAERAMKRRVENAPAKWKDEPERAEKERKTWLPIWLRRIQSYRLER